jgi:hypothetical protein
VERTGRGESFSSIDWESLDEGIRVHLCDPETTVTAGKGNIAKLVLFVESHVPRGSETKLLLTNSIVTDTAGNVIVLPDDEVTLSISPYDVCLEFSKIEYWSVPGTTSAEPLISFGENYVEIASIDFQLLFDTDVFTISDVKKTSCTELFSNFAWKGIEGGIHVTMNDSAAFLQEPCCNPIASIYVDIASSTPYGWYDLILDSIVVIDTSGNEVISKKRRNAEFYIGIPTLQLTDAEGHPGSSGNRVQVNFDNGFDASALQLDLLFDTTNLTVSSVEETERSKHMDLFNWSPLADGIRIAMTNFHPIYPGKGSIADISFNVADDCPLGDHALRFSDVIIEFNYHCIVDRINLIESTFRVVLPNGDANGDGIVSVEDIITAVNIILGLYDPTPHQFSAADCNDDAAVNVLDVVCIVNIILG